jgi:hypothetical protein
MSAPPLPEVFGNYALGDFVEVVAPAAVSWLPQTAGWSWLGMALLLFGLYRGWLKLRQWYRNRYRREAEARLQKLSTTTEGYDLVCEINRLLKLTAMAAFSRQQVAQLSGLEWAEFLNRQCQAPAFSPDQAQLLAAGPYGAMSVDSAGARQLVAASLDWVRQHENPADA